ncbi:MAG TPA: hypothetical protein P5545_07250, partial [Bacteroidota bacterium]|nr:hypothetical protein [Bacteroidota bacterium]
YIFPILFGFISAASIKLQMNFFMKIYFPHRRNRTYNDLKKIANEVVREKKKLHSINDLSETNPVSSDDFEDENHLKISENSEENEEILNAILDKINKEGFNSLTAEEKSFLEEFSKIL